MASCCSVTCPATSVLSLAEVVELVLSFLPTRALCSAARVCRLWRDMARRLARPQGSWLSFVTHHGNNTPCSSRVSMELLIGRVADFLDHLRVFPQAVILFVSRSPEYTDIRRRELKSLLVAVKSRLPSKCSLIGCIGFGIVGQRSGQLAEEIERAEGVSLLIMPRMEGISTHVFNISCTEVRYNRTMKDRWQRSLGIPPEKRIKFALLFAKGETSNNHLDVVGKVASGIWKVYDTDQEDKSDVVIIGGLVESFLDSEIRNSGVVGLGIAGDLHAMSIVHHGDTKQGLKESLEHLRGCGEVGKATACFMVSCVGRGENVYDAKHVEARIFQQQFPGIPIAGFFGNGELGLDLHSTTKRPLNDSHFLHSFSSVFCLCSLGTNNTNVSTMGTEAAESCVSGQVEDEDSEESSNAAMESRNVKFVE